ncbi:MAG: DUF5606 domain-containing protein [Bacteroidales bacterium]|nr:DUF5606 domain-containing protein [Bacteroidales bacterium]
MKTDLSKILAITGQSGLFRFVAQAKHGAVAESIVTGKRSSFGIQTKMTALTDVSIYTDEGDIKLKEVFLKIKDYLGEDGAISAKASPEELKAFFEKVIPDYDRDRFYVSHMKKVVDWYNCLKDYASLDFEETEEAAGTEEEPVAEE